MNMFLPVGFILIYFWSCAISRTFTKCPWPQHPASSLQQVPLMPCYANACLSQFCEHHTLTMPWISFTLIVTKSFESHTQFLATGKEWWRNSPRTGRVGLACVCHGVRVVLVLHDSLASVPCIGPTPWPYSSCKATTYPSTQDPKALCRVLFT